MKKLDNDQAEFFRALEKRRIDLITKKFSKLKNQFSLKEKQELELLQEFSSKYLNLFFPLPKLLSRKRK